MRKRLFALSLLSVLLVSNLSWASSYLITLDATVGERKPVHGKVKVLEGQEGIVSTPDTAIKLVPIGAGRNKVKIQVEAFRKNQNGLQKVTNSALIVRENKPAELSQTTEDGQLLFRIKLTLKKTH